MFVVSAQQCDCRAPWQLELHLHLLLKPAAPCSITAQLGALVGVNCVTERPQPAREQDQAASRERAACAHLPSTLHAWTFSCRPPRYRHPSINPRIVYHRQGRHLEGALVQAPGQGSQVLQEGALVREGEVEAQVAGVLPEEGLAQEFPHTALVHARLPPALPQYLCTCPSAAARCWAARLLVPGLLRNHLPSGHLRCSDQFRAMLRRLQGRLVSQHLLLDPIGIVFQLSVSRTETWGRCAVQEWVLGVLKGLLDGGPCL